MKKMMHTKLFVALLLLVTATLLVSAAFAGTSTETGNRSQSGSSDLLSQLNSLPPFKFEKHKYGIGYGLCPVYTAPYTDAYRCANGKASCQTNAAMDDAGYADVPGWLLVRYEVNSGGYRVGYIPPKYVKGFKSKMAPHFGWIPAKANDYIYVSDNPYRHDDSFGRLDPGESFHILSRYNYYAKEGYDWWYIECYVDGQVARGFIDYYGASFTLGN
ncbi:MAG: hypothetical protein IKE15_03645 [Clostridia bacterium]|nr:hypothetical protein [Clostridia bacterium]